MPSKKNNKKKSAAQKPATSSTTNVQNNQDGDDITPQVNNANGDHEDRSDDEPSTPPTPVDPIAAAERLKEQGNNAFKAKRYGEAVDWYTKAIDVRPQEPAYLTNRAAAYMALKRFRPALNDCQAASQLQAASPQSKTLSRLARCQLALGQSGAALSTIRSTLELDPDNTQAAQLKVKADELDNHLRNFEKAKARKDWAMARLALEKCFQGIEGESSEVPTEWRVSRVELELARGNLDAAETAANDAMRLQPNSPDAITLRGTVLFLAGRLPQASQHAQNAARLDPGYAPAQRLRKRVRDVERLKDEGNTAFKGGRLEEAIEKYGEAIDRIGDKDEEAKGGQIRATLLSNRATTLVKLERHEEALSDVDTALELQPGNWKALRTRARIHLHLEKFEQAIGDFNQSLDRAEFEGAGDTDVRSLRSELKKAEAALKRSKTKDYYKILGISRDATELEIKKGYRRESLKHHPDKGGDEERFKLVVEAHAVLSDPRRRERYDMGEDEDGLNEGGGMGGMGGMHGMNPADIANLFASFGGGFPGGGGGGPFGGGGFGGHNHGGGGGGFHYHSGGSRGFGGF